MRTCFPPSCIIMSYGTLIMMIVIGWMVYVEEMESDD